MIYMKHIENSNKFTPNKKCKILIVFDDLITDMICNKRFQSVIKNYLSEAG